MTKTDYTHITLCVDRSGSMSSTKSDAEGGIKTFLDAQFSAEGTTSVSLYQFDDTFEEVVKFATVNLDYTLVPRGSTALLDAIGRSATETGEALRKMPESERPSKVFLVIVTDGFENASREWTRAKVADLLKLQQEKYNWEVIFLAADISAVHTAAAMGISASNAMSYAGANTSATYASLNTSVLRGRSGGSSAFTSAERIASLGGIDPNAPVVDDSVDLVSASNT